MTAIIGIGLLFIAFVLWSPYFAIRKITPNRNTPYVDILQVQRALDTVYGQNLVFLDHHTVEELLKEQFPSFRSVTLQEQWPDTLLVTIQMAAPLARVWNTDTTRFHVIDDQGVVLPIPAEESLEQIDILQHPTPIEPHTTLIPPEYVSRILLTDDLLERTTGLQITHREYYTRALEYHVTLSSGVQLFFDIQYDTTPAVQLLGYQIPQFSLTDARLEYIDLRIPDELYLKRR